jgi:hypothetical protein
MFCALPPVYRAVTQSLQQAIADARAIVRYTFPWWLRPFLMGGVVGITLGRRIYLARDVSTEQLERFLRHELVHVRQIRRLGLVGFYARYIAEYLGHRRRGLSSAEAYRRISFEMEALAAEETV